MKYLIALLLILSVPTSAQKYPNPSGGGGSGTVTSVGLTVPSFLSVSGSPVTTSGTLALTFSGTAIPIANGGTSATTATSAFNALAPSQASNSGKFLTTNGTNASWGIPGFSVLANNVYLQAKTTGNVSTNIVGIDAGDGTLLQNGNALNGVYIVDGAKNITLFTEPTGTVDVLANRVTLTASSPSGSAKLRILDGAQTHYLEIQAPSSIPINYPLILPPDNGSPGFVLTNNGGGVTTWQAVPAGTSLANNVFLTGRNTGNTADIPLVGTNTSDHALVGTDTYPLDINGSAIINISQNAITSYSGTLTHQFGGNGSNEATVRFLAGNASDYVGIKPPHTVSASYTVELPAAQATSLGMTWLNDGSGILTWAFPSILGVHVTTTGSAPAVSSCGTSPGVVGNDSVGSITVGTGGIATSCTLTFNSTWTHSPACMVSDASTTLLLKGSPTTTVLTITAATPFGASDVISYHCMDYQ